METLFFLIVLAIIILTNVANIRKKMKSAGTDSGGTPGWKKSLGDMIADIKAELEKASGEPPARPRRPSGWEDLLGAGREVPPDARQEPEPEKRPADARTRMETKEPLPMETKEPPRMEKRRETLLEAQETRKAAEERRPPREQPAAAYPELPEMPDAPKARKRPANGGYSVAELRNAVIWYEILGPPVAMRQEDRRMWQ